MYVYVILIECSNDKNDVMRRQQKPGENLWLDYYFFKECHRPEFDWVLRQVIQVWFYVKCATGFSGRVNFGPIRVGRFAMMQSRVLQKCGHLQNSIGIALMLIAWRDHRNSVYEKKKNNCLAWNVWCWHLATKHCIDILFLEKFDFWSVELSVSCEYVCDVCRYRVTCIKRKLIVISVDSY